MYIQNPEKEKKKAPLVYPRLREGEKQLRIEKNVLYDSYDEHRKGRNE